MAAPAVAWFGVGSNVGKVVNCNSDTGWDGSLNVDTINFVEGTASLGEKVSNTTIELYTVNATDVVGEPFDFSVGGGNDGDHIFCWLNIFAAWDTLANGGFGLRVADDLATDSIGTWFVGPQTGYLGGWASYVIDPSQDFDGVVAGTASWTTTGNPAQLSGVDGFGCRWKVIVSITGNTDNSFVDNISVGQGYAITLGDAGSSEGTFGDFVTFEDNVTSGRYGGLREVSGILFVKSKLHIGAMTGAANTEFIDSGFTVVWEQQTLSDGTTSAVAADFYTFEGSQGTGTTDIDISAGSLTAIAPHFVHIDFTGINSATVDAVNVERAFDIMLDSAVDWTGGQVTNSGEVVVDGATFSGVTLTGYNGVADTSQLSWNVATDPDGFLDDTSITKGATAHHAIEFGLTSPLTMTLTGLNLSGFNTTLNGQNDSTLHILRTTGTVTINLVGVTGGTVTYKSAGATVVLVVNPVTTTVNCKTSAGVNIENVRVLVPITSAASAHPFEESVTITSVTTTATVTHTGHGLTTGDIIQIKGANENNYNCVATITVTGTNTYTYTIVATTSPATGTITATYVIISGLTDASGNISRTISYTADQPISGTARKGSATPFYKTSTFTGTINKDSGLAVNVQMILDE